ncbi:MAG: ATP-binding protein [Coriobacteriia bacterium]|nr:ATP-binding protein [Coriobacteriia bacterium]
MAIDRITLTVPAKSEYAKTVRMTAAALVSRMGMNFDDVDDVRMAAEEAFVYAVDTLPDDAEVRFEFSVSDDELQIDVPLGSEDPSSDEEADRRAAYATFILESVCDSYGFESDENGAHLRLTKRVGGADVD